MVAKRILWAVLVALGIGCVALVARLALRDPHLLLDGERGASFVHNVVLLVVLVGIAALFRCLRPGRFLKHLAVWAAIWATLVLGYSHRHDAGALADRSMAEFVPMRGLSLDGAVAFRERRDGHFVIDAEVDGIPVRFLVDTGATDVALPRSFIERRNRPASKVAEMTASRRLTPVRRWMSVPNPSSAYRRSCSRTR